MATVAYNAAVSWTDALATADMNSLANGAGKLSTATVLDNTTNRYLYCDISFIAGGAFAAVAGGHLAVYVLPIASDGSTYVDGADGSDATFYPGMQHYVGAIDFRDTTSLTHVGGLEGIRIGPTKYKFYLINKTGNPLPASGNTLKFSTYTESVA